MARGRAVAIVDDFRAAPQHAQDVRAVVDALLPEQFTASPKVTFVLVQGGSTPHAREAFAAHGYIDVDHRSVVDIIVRWAAGETVPAVVGR